MQNNGKFANVKKYDEELEQVEKKMISAEESGQ